MIMDKQCGDSLNTEYKRMNNVKSKKYHWMKYDPVTLDFNIRTVGALYQAVRNAYS